MFAKAYAYLPVLGTESLVKDDLGLGEEEKNFCRIGSFLLPQLVPP